MIERLHQDQLDQYDFGALTMYSAWRRYPGLNQENLTQILRTDIAKWLHQSGTCIISHQDNHIDALACQHRLTWDSDHFKRPMFRLHMISSGTLSAVIQQELLNALNEETIPPKHSHTTADIDIDDYQSLNQLLKIGFEIMDIKRTYCTNRMREDIDFIRMRDRVRPYHPNDFESIIELAKQTKFPSRFTRDNSLCQEKVNELYTNWFKNLIDDPKSNVLVYCKNNEIVACGAIGEKNLESIGINYRLRTNSLYAGHPKAVGAYTPILYRLIMDALSTHDAVDTTASMNNVTVCRIIEGFRSYKSACATISLRRVTP